MKKILIVDDSTELLELFSMILTSKGNHVRTTTNIADTHALLKWFAPDVILMDVKIKNEDGRQLCHQVYIEHNIPVILISGDADLLENYAAHGARGILAKPFDYEQINQKIQEILPEQ